MIMDDGDLFMMIMIDYDFEWWLVVVDWRSWILMTDGHGGDWLWRLIVDHENWLCWSWLVILLIIDHECWLIMMIIDDHGWWLHGWWLIMIDWLIVILLIIDHECWLIMMIIDDHGWWLHGWWLIMIDWSIGSIDRSIDWLITCLT